MGASAESGPEYHSELRSVDDWRMVTKKGRITVETKGYDAVKFTAVVHAKPKPGFERQWEPNTWRESWTLR